MWLATVRHPPQPIATHCHNTRWEPWLWVPNPCTTNTSRAVMCLSPSSLVQFWPKPCFVISQSTAASNMLPSSIPFLKSASNLILPSRRTKAQRSNKAFFFFLFKQNRVFSRSVHLESHRASLPLPCPQGSSFPLLCPSSMLLHALSLHRTLHNCIISTLPCPLISSYAHLLSPF